MKFASEARDACESAVTASSASAVLFTVASTESRSSRVAVVTGYWNTGSVDPSGRTVEIGDEPYGWTCVVDGTQVSLDFHDAPAPVWPFAGEDEAAPLPDEPPAPPPPQQCLIKGNVSFTSGELIYHVPGQEFYDETVIREDYGERWFCSEEEALAAGWRKSYR